MLNSYRPISLTSVLYKIMLKIINARLVRKLEEKSLLCQQQCGFRRADQNSNNYYYCQNRCCATKRHLLAVFQCF